MQHLKTLLCGSKCTQCAIFVVTIRGTSGTKIDRHPILEALFSPEGTKNIHESVRGKNLITVWAVPRQERKICEEIMIGTGLARLCHWLGKTSTAGNVWRGTAHMVSFYVLDGVMEVEET